MSNETLVTMNPHYKHRAGVKGERHPSQGDSGLARPHRPGSADESRAQALQRLASAIDATKTSWRWRIGDSLARSIECLLGRPKPNLALDDAANLIRDIVRIEADTRPTLLQDSDAHRSATSTAPDLDPLTALQEAQPAERPDQATAKKAKLGKPSAFSNWDFIRGACNVCGRATRFFFKEEKLVREQLVCEHCRSTSRYRSIARGVLRALEERAGVAATALARLPQTGVDHHVRIYDTQPPFRFDVCAYSGPNYLQACDWVDLSISAYDTAKPLGSDLGKGIRNEDLQQLSFADASIDIVITSDVMEHVRVDARAHSEIVRVLKPSGVYLFTVPHNWSWLHTLVRVAVPDPADPASDYNRLPPEYHGDANSPGGQGVLSYRAYGRDLEKDLVTLGLSFSYEKFDDLRSGIKNTELFYCRRRPD